MGRQQFTGSIISSMFYFTQQTLWLQHRYIVTRSNKRFAVFMLSLSILCRYRVDYMNHTHTHVFEAGISACLYYYVLIVHLHTLAAVAAAVVAAAFESQQKSQV